MLSQSASDVREMVRALATHELMIGGSSVPVIFSAPSARALGIVDRVGPAVTLLEADWSGVARGDALPAIDGVTYSVVGIEPDGDGLVTLRLAR